MEFHISPIQHIKIEEQKRITSLLVMHAAASQIYDILTQYRHNLSFEWLVLLLPIREVSHSNNGAYIGYPDLFSSWLSSACPGERYKSNLE